MQKIKAILWDMDGVLIDSEPYYDVTIGEMVHGLGYPYGESEIVRVTGSSYKNIATTLALPEPKEKITSLYVDALVKAIKRVSGLIDGADELLNLLKAKGLKMAIGSSSPKEVVEFAVNQFGLSKWIDVIITGSDAENGKPAPDIYLKCADCLSVEPYECLVIEDSINGIKSGRNAGMKVCAFTGTRHHDFDLSDADFKIDSYSPQSISILMDYIFAGNTERMDEQ
jgi:HAD superfamily hydrolase (TIGR01509 family)